MILGCVMKMARGFRERLLPVFESCTAQVYLFMLGYELV